MTGKANTRRCCGTEFRKDGPSIYPNGFSSALVINQAGVVVVQSFLGGIMLYRDGKLSHVPLSPTHPSHPNGLNSCEVMVG